MSPALEKAVYLIRAADGLLITAGAGMGVDSGLPDFRGNEGMWRCYPELGRRRMDFQDIANPAAFYTTPRLAWGFYGHRLALYRRTVPHAGFHLLRHLGEGMTNGYFVFTSNVDGQFQKAGFDPQRINECHGSIHRLQCLQPCRESAWDNTLTPVIDELDCEMTSRLPLCRFCTGPTRPNILMFGDGGWVSAPYDAQERRLNDWLGTVQRPVVIEVGAGVAIPTVRLKGERFADSLIRINPTDADIPAGRGVSLPMSGLAGIQALTDALRASEKY